MKEDENKYSYFFETQKKYFKELRRRNEDLRAFRHDICAHIAVIRKYIEQNESEKLLAYLADMENKTGLNEIRSYTGNFAVDAVINDQVKNMAEKNIKFSFEGFFQSRKEISDFDLCTIFYNLIKNAVEGCERATSSGGHINVIIKNIGEKTGIIIENDTVLKTLPADYIISTTKEDKRNHGYGMRSIRTTVEKYNGIYNNLIEDGKFIVNIVI